MLTGKFDLMASTKLNSSKSSILLQEEAIYDCAVSIHHATLSILWWCYLPLVVKIHNYISTAIASGNVSQSPLRLFKQKIYKTIIK